VRKALGVTVLLLAAVAAQAAVVPIEEVKEVSRYGDLVLFGQRVTVGGIVTVGSGIFNPLSATLDAYVQDETGGINIYTSNVKGITLAPGDSVVVTGVIDQGAIPPIAGMSRLKITSAADIEIRGSRLLPEPVRLTAAELTAEAEPPLELYEGLLVRIEGVSITGGTWPTTPGSDRDLTLSDGTGSFTMRIDKDTDIDGTAEPAGPFIVVGVVVQNSNFPYLSGYGIWPRTRYEDFLKMGNGCGFASIEPSLIENDIEAFDLGVMLTGNESDTITALSIDLPLTDGWGWAGGSQEVDLEGPGLENAAFEITSTGVIVRDAVIWDSELTYGTVMLRNVSPPDIAIVSTVDVKTSVDGEVFEAIDILPQISAVFPLPPLAITEIYPDDGTTSESNAFIEIHNGSDIVAILEGTALCEQGASGICETVVRYVFTSADTIAPYDRLVVARSAAGFTERFGFGPDIEADINPLGHASGDGGTCGEAGDYEVVSLWRDPSLGSLLAYLEYKEAITCPEDMCEGFGGPDDAFPLVPPVDYSLAVNPMGEGPTDQWVLTAVPTPGEANELGYKPPVVDEVMSYSRDVTEVVFSEPVTITGPEVFRLNGSEPKRYYSSSSQYKVLIFTEDLLSGSAEMEISGIRGLGMTIADTVVTFEPSPTICSDGCEIQAYDDRGFSPLNGQSICMVGFITVPPGVFQPSYASMYIQALDGCGVNVFSYDAPSPRPAIGDLVRVQGEVEEYVSSSAGATTEIFLSAATSLTTLSRAYPEPEPIVLKTGEVSSEDHEGKLVTTEGAVIDATDYDFFLDDGSGGIQVYQNYTPIDYSQFKTGMYIRVTGVILQYDYTMPFLESFELVPRYETDIEILEGVFPEQALLEVDARVFCPSCGDESFAVRFGGEALSDVVLRLFDAAGREVTTLYSGRSVGVNEIEWDGRDDNGNPVSPGLYICFVEIVESVSSKRSTKSVPIVVGMELK
jgi:hypothetical protein